MGQVRDDIARDNRIALRDYLYTTQIMSKGKYDRSGVAWKRLARHPFDIFIVTSFLDVLKSGFQVTRRHLHQTR